MRILIVGCWQLCCILRRLMMMICAVALFDMEFCCLCSATEVTCAGVKPSCAVAMVYKSQQAAKVRQATSDVC